jgi:hypothetical protein
MNLSQEDLSILYSQQLLIPFAQTEKETAWQKAKQQDYQNSAAIWNDFSNRLSLQLLPSLQADIIDDFTVKLWLPENEFSSVWQGVNGSAIDIIRKDKTTTRIVLIPSNEQDISQLRVPREWLELPNWVGNYYLAVEVNDDENYLQVWGYTTYEKLKEKGNYDAIDETYSLEIENLTEDLTSMYASLELYPCPRPHLDSVYVLEAENLAQIMKQLKSATMTLPRLEIPFPQWGAIMDNPELRKSLKQPTLTENVIQKQSAETLKQQAVNLLQWLEKSVTEGWQTLENLIDGDNLNLAYSYRRGNSASDSTVVERVKLIDIPINEEIQSLALVIAVNQISPEKFTLKFKLHTTEEKSLLPKSLQLQMLSSSGKIIQQSEARTNDSLIQLKQVTTTKEKAFQIRIIGDNFSWSESFSLN